MDRPIKATDALSALVAKAMSKNNITLPKQMPAIPAAAAIWWIDMQEPYRDSEMPRKRLVGDSTFWITPYADRLLSTLAKFISLGKPDQEFVIGAAEDKVFWRGDEMEFFSTVYTETMRMREIGLDAYRKESRKAAREVIKEITDKTHVKQETKSDAERYGDSRTIDDLMKISRSRGS